MIRFYSRVPSAAVFREIDGNSYALIPHALDIPRKRITEDHANPRMVRFDRACFHRNGEAYVWFGSVGEGIGIPLDNLPFAVTAIKGEA